MDIQYKIYNSAFKHIKGRELPVEEKVNLKVLKGEKFALQLALFGDEKTLVSLGRFNHIGYKGLEGRVRIDIEEKEGVCVHGSFLGYVLDDDSKTLIADPILKREYQYLEESEPTIIWIEGEVDRGFLGDSIDINVNLFTQKGFEEEEKIERISFKVDVVQKELPSLKDGSFHLDLWQHLSSWARTYEVPFWSDEHFEIIDNFTSELASLGEKVITVVASDFTWEGQGCYLVEENPSNLFEHNIIKVKKTVDGQIKCDFTALERYLDICFRYGMKDEIDIFGILASWKRTDFGNPIKGYDDPIRVALFDEEHKTYSYIDNKGDLAQYLKEVIGFFKSKDLLDRVRIISDMPENSELFAKWSDFLKRSSGEELLFKIALHEDSFMDRIGEFSDITLSFPLLLKSKDRLEEIRDRISGKLGWYVCWFPDEINHFVSSPLIESRLTGWYSYYMGLDGFLRWDYALWTGNPFDNISYKYPRWKAGDMFFVYPGRDMKPIRSIRWENLRFGLQDHLILKMAEEKIGKEEVQKLLKDVFGDKRNMIASGDFTVEVSYSTEYREYMTIRNSLIEIIK